LPSPEVDRRAFRLLPSEQVLWHGQRSNVPRDQRWTVGPALLGALALVFAAFGGLLAVAGYEGAQQNVALAAMLTLFAIAVAVAPRYLHDPCEYVVTDRRVLWRRGPITRSIERAYINYGRIRWHRSVAGVGHLELVRAVPFGPLARRQRILLLDVRAPDAVYAIIRGVEPSENLGTNDVPLVERLDPGETVLWGGHPEGLSIGVREAGSAVLGALTVAVALRYGYNVASILVGLEDIGLQVQSLTWALFFFAVVVTWAVIGTVGVALFWHGVFRARALGRDTEYILTEGRLLIRRGTTELSVDRRRIVDVADTRTFRGLHNVFLVLDAPESRALADSGALSHIPPPRDSVQPVLYELRDVELLKRLILGRTSTPSAPPVRDAA
jgi:hypothetical protein